MRRCTCGQQFLGCVGEPNRSRDSQRRPPLWVSGVGIGTCGEVQLYRVQIEIGQGFETGRKPSILHLQNRLKLLVRPVLSNAEIVLPVESHPEHTGTVSKEALRLEII